MYSDVRPYCEHGPPFVGPCSAAKHEAIKTLNPYKEGRDKEDIIVNPLLAFAVMFANMIDNTRFTPDGLVCKCCKALIK